ncbi:hypothetical protein [Radiobacillus sp. PE A8.2]|uniref:hypothetical protein n=1 Tax=Radiobacillus sp. PE A8.2 TaxID=3380349 RepID=UPI00388F4A2A
MKKNIINQQGYALVLVLLTITVIGILTPPIINSLLNSTQQYQRSEENIQLQKLIEMGKMYARKEIEVVLTPLPTSLDEAKATLQSSLTIEEVSLDSSNDNMSFTVSYKDYVIEANELKITYEITAKLEDNNEVLAEKNEFETFIVNKENS